MTKTINKIQGYEFGKIKINEQEIDYDIALTDESIEKWWRKTSHNVEPSDVKEFIEKYKPELVIFGNGHDGMMQVPEETKKFIQEKGIEIIVQKTGEAVKIFNKENKKKIAFLHLTC